MVYASTELHLLTDKSPEFNATWEFLERRIEDVLAFGRTANDLATVGGAAFKGALSLLGMFKTYTPEEVTGYKRAETKEKQINLKAS